MNTVSAKLIHVATFPRMRALLWSNNFLYASRGYKLLRAQMDVDRIEWQAVAGYKPEWWRNVTSSMALGSRLFRDGFHALAMARTGHLVAALPGAIAALNPGETIFRTTHKILRGIRPLHVATTPDGRFYWGEYFDNPQRDEVHIYGSMDHGGRWDVAYTFPRSAVRHVHNIIADPWQNCLWIMTGDNGSECRILRASHDFATVETVLSGNQQARSVAAVPTEDGLTFSSDTPLENNFVYRLGRNGQLSKLADLSSSSIYGCRVGEYTFFSTMVEPSAINRDQSVGIYSGSKHGGWRREIAWKKDFWPMRYFQYGNAIFPDGNNSTDVLAVSTVAVHPGDGDTFIYRVSSQS